MSISAANSLLRMLLRCGNYKILFFFIFILYRLFIMFPVRAGNFALRAHRWSGLKPYQFEIAGSIPVGSMGILDTKCLEYILTLTGKGRNHSSRGWFLLSIFFKSFFLQNLYFRVVCLYLLWISFRQGNGLLQGRSAARRPRPLFIS